MKNHTLLVVCNNGSCYQSSYLELDIHFLYWFHAMNLLLLFSQGWSDDGHSWIGSNYRGCISRAGMENYSWFGREQFFIFYIPFFTIVIGLIMLDHIELIELRTAFHMVGAQPHTSHVLRWLKMIKNYLLNVLTQISLHAHMYLLFHLFHYQKFQKVFIVKWIFCAYM